MNKEAREMTRQNELHAMAERINAKRPLNLQFFAEPGEAAEEQTENKAEDTTQQTEDKPEEKSFSQSDVERILADRLARAEKQFKVKLEKEKSEAEKLATMTAEERAKAQFQKEKEEFEAEKKSLESQKLELQTRKELANEGLNEGFAPFILNTIEENTAEKVKDMIASFKSLYETDLAKKVDERLSKPTPKSGQSQKPLDISKMTADEINANWDQISKM